MGVCHLPFASFISKMTMGPETPNSKHGHKTIKNPSSQYVMGSIIRRISRRIHLKAQSGGFMAINDGFHQIYI